MFVRYLSSRLLSNYIDFVSFLSNNSSKSNNEIVRTKNRHICNTRVETESISFVNLVITDKAC